MQISLLKLLIRWEITYYIHIKMVLTYEFSLGASLQLLLLPPITILMNEARIVAGHTLYNISRNCQCNTRCSKIGKNLHVVRRLLLKCLLKFFHQEAGRATSSEKISKTVEFRLWAKQCNFPKSNFFPNFYPNVRTL